MTTETTFITIRDDHRPGDDWPEGEHDIVTGVMGDLADKLRAHHDKTGQVEIHQHGDEGGYSEYTVEWDWEAWLTIGGERVGPRVDSFSQVDDWSDEVARARAGKPTWSAQQITKHLIDVGAGTDG